MCTRLYSLIFIIITITACLATVILGGLFFIARNQSIDFSALEHNKSGNPTILLDDEGNEWARFQLDRREPIAYSQMPMHLINAFVAAEDWNFFHHNGISFKGIVRSALVNLYHCRKVQGASTITQQLVKLLFFNAEKTFKRKIQEQIYALIIECQYTKEQIIQTYLNHVYFGCGIYGAQAASQQFWGKNASGLTAAESATLAAIIRSPLHYCPILCPLSCERRRNLILTTMRTLGYISDEDHAAATTTALVILDDPSKQIAPHLKEHIRGTLEKMVGRNALYQQGLMVQTTLNRAIQTEAERAFSHQITQLHAGRLPQVDGALVTLDAQTGAMKALIGGADFHTSKFNRALHAKRQIGSTFKPLLYAAALHRGATFADTAIDEPIAMPHQNNNSWQPNNALKTFEGTMTLARALSYSNNIIAIKTLLDVGIDSVVALARQCHLPEPIPPYPSLALGCIDAAPVDVASMFNIFAHDGIYVKPHCIAWIKDKWGNKIYKEVPSPERILPSRIVGQVNHVLRLGLERAKKRVHTNWPDCQTIGKTGTSDSKTCWFVGSTPELTTAVYMGYDDAHSMGSNIFPIHTAFPIWAKLHGAIACTVKEFTLDPALQLITINDKTGERTTQNDPDAIIVAV